MQREDTRAQALGRKTLEPLSLGTLRPGGWLLNQLRIQAAGLTGHLDEFWPDVAASRWIGGTAEGWERGPYWLDGLVPLAFLLNDERLIAKAHHWIGHILSHQHADGWLGPVHDERYGYPHDPWPVFLVLKAMTQYQEATGDPRVVPAMARWLRRLDALLVARPLQSWARMRWPDLLVSVCWLYERSGEDWLLALAQKVHDQGYDWRAHFADFRFPTRQTETSLENHVVNHAMAIKAAGVWARQAPAEAGDVLAAMAVLDRYHGQATGVFTGDELLAGRNPSQGTELCAVVEYLYSLEVLLAILGQPALADRLERITYNALPAAMTPDMWAHQYDQQANQVVCRRAEDRIYTNNGPDANIFGLAPNYGCCTANLHQGWPKFAAHLWMRGVADESLVALAYAPCHLETSVAGTPVRLSVETDYPFEETVRLTITAAGPVRFPLRLRIPAWTAGAEVAVSGEAPRQAEAGAFHTLERAWGRSTALTLRLPMAVRLQRRYHGAVALERGPLVYALKIGEEWRQVGGELPHADWEVYPTTPWNYALALDPAAPAASVSFTTRPVDDRPFSPEGAPVEARAHARRLPGWTLEHNAAGPLPSSPVTSSEPLEEISLLPYGCTNLRITEFPLLAPPDSAPD
jgi:hypothetical protein